MHAHRLLTLAACGLGTAIAFAFAPLPVQGQGGGAAPVEVASIEKTSVAAGKVFLGTVVPRRRSLVGSAVDGRVESLVDDGELVHPGEEMVKLRTGTIEILLMAAKAELELREQELKEAEAGSRPEEVDRARAQLASAEALREYRVAAFERIRQLFMDSRTASREEFEEALQARAVAEQLYLERKANLALVLAGPREEQVAQARARREIANEEVHRLEDRMEKYSIKAPFEGYVVAKHAEVGRWLKEGDLVMEVVQLDPIEIEVSVPESYVGPLRKGMTAQIRVAALNDLVILGEVSRIVPQADLRSRAFPVKIQLANPNGPDGHLLKAGMLAHVTLAVGGSESPGLTVPKDALVLGGPSPLVYVVQPGKAGEPTTARPVPVQIGVANGSRIQVIGDLAAGQQVVTRGNERLRPGQPITILPTAGKDAGD